MIGSEIRAKTIELRNIWRYRRTLQNLISLLPNAGAIRDPVTNAKLFAIDNTIIPVVSDPSPSPAKYFSSIWPTKAALTSWYIGWKIMPMIGQIDSLRIVWVDVQKPKQYSGS